MIEPAKEAIVTRSEALGFVAGFLPILSAMLITSSVSGVAGPNQGPVHLVD
jgi:hypothetical protein